jgi:hypothetical protein
MAYSFLHDGRMEEPEAPPKMPDFWKTVFETGGREKHTLFAAGRVASDVVHT